MSDDVRTWSWRLDKIQAALEVPAKGIEVCFLSRMDSHSPGAVSKAYLDSFPYGRALSLYTTYVSAYENQDMDSVRLVDLGGRPFQFVVSWGEELLGLYKPGPGWPDGADLLWFAPWSECHYYEEDERDSARKKGTRLKDDLDRLGELMKLYSAVMEACHLAPQCVPDAVGDLSLLESWPTALLYLALKRVHPLLNTAWIDYRWGLHPKASAVIKDFGYHYVVEIQPCDVLTATSYAFDALRQICEMEATGPSDPPVPALVDEEPPKPNVTADVQRGVICINGNDYPAAAHHCQIVKALVEAKGLYVTGPKMTELPGCCGKKISRELKNLFKKVPELKKYIRSEGPKGYRLVFP